MNNDKDSDQFMESAERTTGSLAREPRVPASSINALIDRLEGRARRQKFISVIALVALLSIATTGIAFYIHSGQQVFYDQVTFARSLKAFEGSLARSIEAARLTQQSFAIMKNNANPEEVQRMLTTMTEFARMIEILERTRAVITAVSIDNQQTVSRPIALLLATRVGAAVLTLALLQVLYSIHRNAAKLQHHYEMRIDALGIALALPISNVDEIASIVGVPNSNQDARRED